MALVSQEPVLFSCSIRENIAYSGSCEKRDEISGTACAIGSSFFSEMHIFCLLVLNVGIHASFL